MVLPPGPPLPPVLQGGMYVLRPFEMIDECVRRYGDLFTLRLPSFGTLVCATHPDTIRDIFTADPEAMRVGKANEPFRPLIGDSSILLADGPEHHFLRRLVYPLFHGDALASYAPHVAAVMAEALLRWSDGRPVEVYEAAQRITLDVILRVLFGSLSASDSRELWEAFATLVNENASPFAGLLMVPTLQRDLGPLTPWAAFRRCIDRIDAAVFRQIELRARQTGPLGGDVLDRILAAGEERGAPFERAALRDHLVTLVMAGHETTAASLTWAFSLILEHPEVLRRIVAELDGVVGGEPLRHEHMALLPYLDAVVHEVLRMRPVVPIIGVGRLLERPMSVQGFTLPAGVKLVPLIYGTHMRPDIYPSPTSFRPERFLDKKVDPYTWLPFGGGVRRCLGLGFAMYEIKFVLASAFSSARLVLQGKPASRPTLQGITIVPEVRVKMKLAGRRRVDKPFHQTITS